MIKNWSRRVFRVFWLFLKTLNTRISNWEFILIKWYSAVQHSYARIQRTTSNTLTEPTFNPRFFNPFTARVFDRVFWGNSNFWVCGRNPMMWQFKWKPSACTFTWCYLFVKILENEIWKFGRNLPLATFGSERVNQLWTR